MEAVKLCGIFIVIMLLLRKKISLMTTMLIGAGVSCLLFGIPVMSGLQIAGKSLISNATITLLLTFYLVTFLQRMLEARGHLMLAQRSLDGIFHNRRINASLASVFIGLLPTAGAVTICGALVDEACGDYLTKAEKTFVTSYYRHIPESFLPTYSSVIIACQITGISVGVFLLGMLPMVAVLLWLGYAFYLHKVPKETGLPPSRNKKGDLRNLWVSLWSIVIIVALIIVFPIPIYVATPLVLLVSVVVNGFSPEELKGIFVASFEQKLLLSTAAIMIFKDVITATGVMETLPGLFATLPIPEFMIFSFIFFFGTVVGGNMAVIVLCLPLAFATISGSGMPLLVLLMCFSYAAMQVSPTHVCLAIVTEYFGIDMTTMIKKTIPVIVAFSLVAILYYLVMTMIF